MSLRVLLISLLIIAAAAVPSQVPRAEAAEANLAALGRQKFTQRHYDEAIDLFRKHLRRFPKDYNTWNELGAAYYHTGQPRKALRYLKHVERLTSEKSYNYYYQGLCYIAAEIPDKARDFFTFAAQRFTDEYASRSTFEVAVMEYNAKNKPRATYWLNYYMQRYPTGVYAAEGQRLLQSMRENRWMENVEASKKPDMEDALFRYNKLSLSPHPHYWYVQTGWDYVDHEGQEPAPGGQIKARPYRDMAGIVNAGIGIGPWHQGETTIFGGYTYRQLWHTDEDRFQEWVSGPTDLTYFPLRGDLLERKHQFYGDFRRDVAGFLYYGVFGRYEFDRIGSSLFPSPENEELRKVLKISDTQLLIPWIGFTYAQNARTLLYLYLRKELNYDSPYYSNKSYDFGGSGGQPITSFGISHTMEFPEYSIALDLELFQYEFIYNDYWLDYKRDGFLFSIEHEFIPRWFASGLIGYYRDQYVLPRWKQSPCGSGIQNVNTGATDPTNPNPGVPHACPRVDTGDLYQLGVYWNWTQFQRIAASLQYVENKNADQKEFEESKQTIEVTYTMAFPSVKRVERLVDRYADTAFTKEPE